MATTFTIIYVHDRVCIEHILWFQRCQFSVFSFPCHPSEKGGGSCGSLVVASCEEGRWPKSQRSGSSVLNTEWQIGTLLTTSVQSALLSIFQETSVCNSCMESSSGLWVTPSGSLPVTPIPSNESTSQWLTGWEASVAHCLLPLRWISLTRAPRQRPQAGWNYCFEILEKT